MGSLVSFEKIDNFREALSFAPREFDPSVITTVRSLDERNELEPFVRWILTDVSETPHGPAEIVDIFTHKVTIAGNPGLAAFILKGKSFPKVRPEHVGHQIYRLEKITDLSYAILGTTGVILDQAKEQFVSTAARTTKNYCILDAHDFARLFVGAGFLCPKDGRKIVAGRCMCGYSPSFRLLNILQEEALKELRRTRQSGRRAGLVVLPPGSGKTRIAAEDAKAANAKSILYVAHRRLILEVAVSEFEAVFGKQNVVKHTARPVKNARKRVNVASIQLVQQHLSYIKPDDFDYIVVDEFHHAAAQTYRRLLSHVDPEFLLGLTATPYRGDRQDILELCEGNTIVQYELRVGVDSGILAPFHYFGCFDDVDYTDIRHEGKRYDVRDLERALIIPERDAAIIEKWRELAEGKPTVAFCCSHLHARRVAASFRSAGIPAETYISETGTEARRVLQQRFQTGELKVLCTVDIFNEGVDFPYIEALLFLRPTESSRIFLQQLGRGLRKYVGKSHCVVIDFIGNFRNAYRILDYQSLVPESIRKRLASRTLLTKPVLDLPAGCRVEFDQRVIDLFFAQRLDPHNATRHTIGRILIYQYQKAWRRLGRRPTQIEIDRTHHLGRRFYRDVFGSWEKFQTIMNQEGPGEELELKGMDNARGWRSL